METGILQESTKAYLLMRATTTLKNGGIVIAPSDTVYGIYANALDNNAVKKIFVMKKRSKEKPLGVFVKDVATARKIAYISDAKAKFLDRVWPGAVTVVFHHKDKMSPVLTSGAATVGMRIPNDSFLSLLLEQCDMPLAQTSANISGTPPAKTIEDIKTYFTDIKCQPDLMIDGGPGNDNPSAVIDYTGQNPLLIRMGMITKNQLDELLSGVVRQS